jgi:hypothetical protein
MPGHELIRQLRQTFPIARDEERLKPFAAKVRARANPMPEEAPVIKTHSPFMFAF